MKKILIVFFCLITVGLRAQIDSLIAKSSENLPDKSIVDKYPLLFATIKQMQVEEPKLKKVYYGRFNSNGAIKAISTKKGIILFDIDYLERNTKEEENYSIWQLLINVGAINFGFGIDEPLLFDLAKSKYLYALNKAKSIDEVNNSNVLKKVIARINISANTNKDMNNKMAAEEVRNCELFKKLNNNNTQTQTTNINTSNQTKESEKLNSKPEISNNKVENNDERIKKAMKMMSEEKDEFTNVIYYYDKRFDTHHFSGDGVFAGINSETKLIKLVVYHKGDAALINNITIKAGEEFFTLKCEKMKGNGTGFSYKNVTGIGNDKSSYSYKILKLIVNSGICMIRFDTQFGRIDDYTLTKREIKEIATVVEAYEAINGL